MIQASTIELAIGVGGRPGQHPVSPLALEGPELRVEVHRPLGTRAGDSVDGGGDRLVLEQMQLVDFTALPANGCAV
jgi:hypothetical protein